MSERKRVRVLLTDLESAFVFVSFETEVAEHSAWISRSTGEVHDSSEEFDDEASDDGELDDAVEQDAADEAADEDAADEDAIPVPHKNELGLGRPLVMRFMREEMPDDEDAVVGYFSRRGAYARFKDLLAHRGMLERWNACEQDATREALREWCEENDLELADDREQTSPPRA